MPGVLEKHQGHKKAGEGPRRAKLVEDRALGQAEVAVMLGLTSHEDSELSLMRGAAISGCRAQGTHLLAMVHETYKAGNRLDLTLEP